MTVHLLAPPAPKAVEAGAAPKPAVPPTEAVPHKRSKPQAAPRASDAPAQPPSPSAHPPIAKPLPPPEPAAAPTAEAPPQKAAEAPVPAGHTAAPVSSDQPATSRTDAPSIPASFDAAYLRNPPPEYPRLSRRRGEEGRVLLRVHVLASGLPDNIEIVESSGHPRLDQAAHDTVWHWRFRPARSGETAIESWLQVPIEFRLED